MLSINTVNTALKIARKAVAPFTSKLGLVLFLVAALLYSAAANAEYALNFQEPVTQIARDIYWLHMLIIWICVAIFVVVFGVMFYSIFKHRKSKNYQPAKFSHSTKVEIIWTTIPFLILIAMAAPATLVLIDMEDTTQSDLTIKITGYQWKWGYEYLDTDINFYSTLSTPREQIDQFDKDNAVPQGENYLLEVDNHLVVPSGRKVRALITSNDVIHAWWIPAFGTKKDAVPGYINELWFNVDVGKEGIYRGQCAELCGKDHAFMPIVVEVLTGAQFDSWIESGGTNLDSISADSADALSLVTISDSAASIINAADTVATADAVVNEALDLATDQALAVESEATDVVSEPVPAVSAKTWTDEELMIKGKQVASRCIACHGAEGKGIPGVFPAIAGSAVATGPMNAHIDTVMFGKEGTAMAAFANQLSDEDLAAVITYQRNSFGNSTGDVVLPADIKAKRN